ncbi:MAG: hypothetical protein KF859_10740 [Phycisphaeraceae bacterium]|nr:hypothetical protein [Phycisphaeraceae bacterium]
MSQVASPHSIAAQFPALRADNITLPPGSGKGLGTMLMAAGLACVVAAAAIGVMGIGGVFARQALAAYHIGAMCVLAMSLGALFFVLVFHLTQAGWVAAFRRQAENVMAFLPFAYAMVLPTLIIEIATGGKLFKWLSKAATGEYVLEHKSFFFFGGAEIGTGHVPFPTFFVVRALVYGAVWTLLSRRLLSLSLLQDSGQDPAAFAKARFTSAWGMLLFALTTAFAAFDWLMSLDYVFFSTMWGIYYFSGAAFSSAALIVLILAALRGAGKLQGAVTHEHFHDLGKLMFSFTVFWGYIAFSQYFLIWYSNIPEETAFFKYRSEHWKGLGILLMVGHFVVPFLIVLFRGVKRNYRLLAVMALWAILMQVVDIYWIVRPIVYAGNDQAPTGAMVWITDILGVAGPLAIFFGYLITTIPKGPLLGVGDPFLRESLEHKNYV